VRANPPLSSLSQVSLFLEPLAPALGAFLSFGNTIVVSLTFPPTLLRRCPTECRLSRGAPNAAWQCRVALRFTHDRTGQPLGQARNEDFGPVIFDKALVEERIRRAQRAILNPSSPRTQFLEGEDEDLDATELSFSSNVVSLAISGPGVADLSFCDLPGTFAIRRSLTLV
jgi:hypothetical protein